jgi:hypothetical protein
MSVLKVKTNIITSIAQSLIRMSYDTCDNFFFLWVLNVIM